MTVTVGGRTSFLTYEPYYGLKEKPFSLSADPRFLYKSQAHGPTFEALRAGIRRREGVIVLTGEPGTGKTTLCRGVLEALDRKTFCTLVPDPFVSREDLLKMLLIDFGVLSVEDLKSGRLQGATRPELSYPLYDFLKSLVPLQAYAVLIIDEAQNLSPQVLEEIRILADLEAPEKLLQLVLVGQPELRAKLKDHAMRQVDQRVSVRVDLTALDRVGVGEYIAHRLNIAGSGTDRVTFSDEAVDAIFRATKGNPRVINLVCDKSLHHGHLARTFTIGPDIVKSAASELGISDATPAETAPAPAATTATSAPSTLMSSKPAPLQEPDPADDFGLNDKFFDRPRSSPEDVGPLSETPAPHLLDVEDADAPASGKRRKLLWMLLFILLGGWGFWTWQQPQRAGQNGAAPAPSTSTAAQDVVRAQTEPPPTPDAPLTGTDAAGQPFEVGVAVFSGYDRANRLAVALAASGFRAITRPVENSQGRMYEVRTGPYQSREEAEKDASIIRKLPGYADARVMSMSAPAAAPSTTEPSAAAPSSTPAAAPSPTPAAVPSPTPVTAPSTTPTPSDP